MASSSYSANFVACPRARPRGEHLLCTAPALPLLLRLLLIEAIAIDTGLRSRRFRIFLFHQASPPRPKSDLDPVAKDNYVILGSLLSSFF
ncbi:hypothetical protein GUJ93_ZPchr0010g10455 [Zizania palustris]|uniref:Uncharacterized protein n=1 Tax=Zizania palustris TaxID=103762 RepID=A0A8J5WE24_ZIZPA|nr:hypothetical protein GUJ93_ZPchr0010g10455 [Zizania palustris]